MPLLSYANSGIFFLFAFDRGSIQHLRMADVPGGFCLKTADRPFFSAVASVYLFNTNVL